MNVRKAALLAGAKYYEGRCAKNPAHHRRWTGSGACVDCHPRRRGTLVTAMTALFGPARVSLEYAREKGLPLFRAVCNAQGHASWRYVKTPHICLQCVAAARKDAKPAPRKAAKPAAVPARRWYFVMDLCSGLAVSYIGYSSTAAAQVRREIKQDHPSLLPIVSVWRESERARREIQSKGVLRLDRYPDKPDWPGGEI
jgi:hypothetical protein